MMTSHVSTPYKGYVNIDLKLHDLFLWYANIATHIPLCDQSNLSRVWGTGDSMHKYIDPTLAPNWVNVCDVGANDFYNVIMM